MTAAASARSIFAAAVPAVLTVAGCFIHPTDFGSGGGDSGDTCVPAYQAGQSLTVRLGARYDASSDYWHMEGWLGPSLPNTRSCLGEGNLETGRLLTFTLKGLESGGGDCRPYGAALQPEIVANTEEAGGNLLPTHDGVTIALAIVTGTLDNRPLFAFRGLFTPSGDPNGTLTLGALPPLVVAQHLSYDDRYDECYDAWVATWEPTP
jgi:hypothetical protein